MQLMNSTISLRTPGRMGSLPAHLAAAALSFHFASSARAQYRVSPAEPYAYGANTGWINAGAAAGSKALRLGPCVCAGLIYSGTCGWINLGSGAPADGQQYSNTTGQDSGVNVLPDGSLRGLAWGASIGWINFESTGNPRLNKGGGTIEGMAWSAGTGWICFDTPQTDFKLISGDTDSDGIPDSWELLYAPNLTILGDNQDADSDGLNDADEYAADTDPRNAADKLDIVHFEIPGNGSAGTLQWTGRSTRSYRVQASPDLSHWTWISPFPVSGQDGGFTAAGLPASEARSFYRVIPLKPPAGEE